MLPSNLTHNRTHLRSHCHIYHDHAWYLFVSICRCKDIKSDSAIFANSSTNNSESSGPITFIIELIRDLIITYILTKFGADWLIFVDARV